jgi:hypothetical protein
MFPFCLIATLLSNYLEKDKEKVTLKEAVNILGLPRRKRLFGKSDPFWAEEPLNSVIFGKEKKRRKW